jgi:predicted lysophospholipase L1 biosynthesis ABC-type transport system permease subunit
MQRPCHNPAVVAFVAAVALSSMLDAAPTILVSRQLAARARLHVGDLVTVAADPRGERSRTFRVAGVYEPTPDPMRFTAERIEARMHLPDLISLTADPDDPGAGDAIGAIHVALTDPAAATPFAADASAGAPMIAVRPTARASADDPFAVLDRFHVAISAVTVFGATAFLLALMVIRAEERRDTVAILRLVGISHRSLLKSVAVEGLVIAIGGAIFGVALAFATESLINRFFQARYDTTLVFIRVTAPLALKAVIVAAPLGIFAGVAASWTLLRRNILSLFRR